MKIPSSTTLQKVQLNKSKLKAEKLCSTHYVQSLLAPPHEGESPDGLTMAWCAALVVVGACDVSKSLRPPHLPTPVCVCECVSVGVCPWVTQLIPLFFKKRKQLNLSHLLKFQDKL